MKESGTSVVRPGFIAGAFHRLSNRVLHGRTWTARTAEPGSGGLGSAEFGWGAELGWGNLQLHICSCNSTKVGDSRA